MNIHSKLSDGNRSRLRKSALVCVFAWLGFGPVWAADPAPGEFLKRYPVGSIQSTENADRALADAARERAKLEARYGKEERECYEKFFVTSCIDDAKERRRVELNRIRPIELEAKSFKRRARAAERDQALIERRAKEEAEAPQRAIDQNERNAARSEKAANDEVQRKAREVEAQHNAAQSRRRMAEHDAKQKHIKAEQAADAKKRAENVAAYERKVKAAQQHQREVAAKKAEKEAAKKASASASCCAKP